MKSNDFIVFELADIEHQMAVLIARKKELLEIVKSKFEQLKEAYRRGEIDIEEMAKEVEL
ncbi:MAG TPA: hypothetical protein VIK78_14495 [Ruminiclostridium sp.]